MTDRNDIFREYLTDFLEEKKQRNPSYSLRTLAAKIQISPGALSLFLNKKRKFSDQMIDSICDRLYLSPEQRREIFSHGFEAEETKFLEQSLFERISNWLHDAFLELIQTKGFQPKLSEISRRFNTEEQAIRNVIENLLELELIKVEDNTYKPLTPSTQVYANKRTTTALKKLQLDANYLSRQALETLPVEKRYHGTNTLTIDPDRIEEAKQFIREFREKFCTKTSWKGRGAVVHQLNISFYPLEGGQE